MSDIGVHSERKGSTTYTFSLSTTISAVAVYLRAGWSIGNVQDRYIFMGCGSDQVVGRAVSGLPINSIDFGTLPPHFLPEDERLLASIGWENMLNGYANLPASFKPVVPFLIASLVYHIDFHREKLRANHSIFKCPLFTRQHRIGNSMGTIMDYFKQKIVTGTMHCKATNMQATGVPPHLSVLQKISSLMDSFTELREHFDQQIATIPTLVKEMLLNNFVVDGVAPVSRMDLDQLKETLTSTITALVERHHQTGHQAPAPRENHSQNNNAGPFTLFCWGGKYHFVPENFRFPNKITLRSMWDLWWFGDVSTQIRPYIHIHRSSLKLKKDQTLYDKAKKVTTFMTKVAVEKGLLQENQQIHDQTLSQNVFTQIFTIILQKSYGDKTPSRPNELSYVTIADRLK